MAINKPLTEKRFVELFGKLFEKHAQKLDLATRSDIEKNRQLIVEGRDLLLEAIHKRVDDVVDSLDNLELNTVKRNEFEALKRKVERYQPVS
jgi:hypothetical protein